MLRLAAKVGEGESPDRYSMLNQAVADIDRSLMVQRAPLQRSRYPNDAGEALEDMRTKLFMSGPDDEELEAQANRLWQQYRSQEGFIFLLRKAFELARAQDKGNSFRKVYDKYLDVIRMLEAQEIPPTAALYEVGLHIYYYWQVHRAAQGIQGTRIDWLLLEALAKQVVAGNDPQRQNAFHRFVLALAYAHNGGWNNAEQIFAELRRAGVSRDILWAPRCYLLGDNDKPKRLQGIVKESSTRTFIYVESLERDFHADNTARWPREGEMVHCYLRFSFGGCRAVPRHEM